MFLSLIVFVSCITLIHAAPQGNSACADVPTNPDAAQIGAQYLSIPGCSGSNSGGSGGSGASSAVNSISSSSTASQPQPSNTNRPPIQHTSTQQQTAKSNSSSGSTIGPLFKSSITRYGQGPPGTPGTDKHCQAHEGACGNNPQSGWTAAASQFLYFNGGSGLQPSSPGSPGSACGTCWRVTGATDSSGTALSPAAVPAVVLITNECAAQDPGQPVNLCGMSSLTATNALGANVNIDLCMDSGAAEGFFDHPAPWGTAVGTAQQVDCANEWCGVWANGTKSGPAGCSAPGADYADTT